MSDICETCGRHQFHIGCRFVPGLDFKLATAWHRGDGQLMFHICCKFHTHVLLCVSLMFQLYSIYVLFAFHICFVLCLTYVSHTFHICFVYVSHMLLLTPRHSLCLRHASSTLYRNHPWSTLWIKLTGNACFGFDRAFCLTDVTSCQYEIATCNEEKFDTGPPGLDKFVQIQQKPKDGFFTKTLFFSKKTWFFFTGPTILILSIFWVFEAPGRTIFENAKLKQKTIQNFIDVCWQNGTNYIIFSPKSSHNRTSLSKQSNLNHYNA